MEIPPSPNGVGEVRKLGCIEHVPAPNATPLTRLDDRPSSPHLDAALRFAINEHLPRCRQVTPTRALGGFPEVPPRVVELEVGDLGDLELRGAAGVEQRGGQRDRDGHEAGADREGELVAVDQRRGA